MPGNDDSKWKDKYLRSLDDLEEKEKSWEQAEDLLRRAVGRLAHTGYGLDHTLDKQLDRVRNAVKGKKDAKTLERLVHDASETAASIQEREQEEAAGTGQAIAGLLSGFEFTGGEKKQAKRLVKKLESLDKDESILPLLEQAATLIKSRNPAARPQTTDASEPEPQPAKRGGLFSRLMGNHDESSPSAATVEPVVQAATAISETKPGLSAGTIETFLSHVETGKQWSERISLLRQKAAACRDEKEIMGLMQETAAVMSEIVQHAESADSNGQTLVETLPSAGEALLELMARIEIPHHLQERLGVVKSALMHAKTAKQVQLVVQSIADLMSEIRREVQKEKKELEAFLEGVTNRIQTLSENVIDLGHNRQASDDSRKHFHLSFQDHMDGIRTRMADTDDVESLKHAIQDGLDAIEDQLGQYVRREEELTKDAEERIANLSSRLHDMKNEAFMLQKKMQEQRDKSMKDPLTGVFNRLAFDEHIENEFHRWKRYKDPLSLCIVDIDHFKKVNDTFGHLAGDKALKATAARLLKNVREVDIVCRYGGEEFIVIMPKTPAPQAYKVAEKLRSVIASAGFHYREKPVHITVSCGLATFREEDDPQSVFQRADDALYGAKKAGRNRTHTEDEQQPTA